MKRLGTLCLASAIALTTLTCQDRGDLVSPVEPQFAKGGKPAPAEPKLEEFWVYQDLTDCPGKILHIVVSGDFLRIATSLAHDHFFNGVRDMGFHLEYGFREPDSPPTVWNADGTLGHVDVCFQGEQIDHVFPGGEEAHYFYVDYPSTSVDDTGADPFAITIAAVISEKNSSQKAKGFRPTGVVVDGEIQDPEVDEVTSSWHPGQTLKNVRSYIVWDSPPPLGYLFYEGITVSNVSCQVSTAIVGRGKNKTEVTNTTVTAEVEFDFGAEDLPETGLTWDQDHWGEGHLRVVPPEGSAVFTSDRYRTANQDGTVT